jgi:hypothetical protein
MASFTHAQLRPSSANLRPCLSAGNSRAAQTLVRETPNSLATANAGALVLPVLMAGSVLGDA